MNSFHIGRPVRSICGQIDVSPSRKLFNIMVSPVAYIHIGTMEVSLMCLWDILRIGQVICFGCGIGNFEYVKSMWKDHFGDYYFLFNGELVFGPILCDAIQQIELSYARNFRKRAETKIDRRSIGSN